MKGSLIYNLHAFQLLSKEDHLTFTYKASLTQAERQVSNGFWGRQQFAWKMLACLQMLVVPVSAWSVLGCHGIVFRSVWLGPNMILESITCCETQCTERKKIQEASVGRWRHAYKQYLHNQFQLESWNAQWVYHKEKLFVSVPKSNFCLQFTVTHEKMSIFPMFFFGEGGGIKCSVNHTLNNTWTKPSVETFGIQDENKPGKVGA